MATTAIVVSASGTHQSQDYVLRLQDMQWHAKFANMSTRSISVLSAAAETPSLKKTSVCRLFKSAMKYTEGIRWENTLLLWGGFFFDFLISFQNKKYSRRPFEQEAMRYHPVETTAVDRAAIMQGFIHISRNQASLTAFQRQKGKGWLTYRTHREKESSNEEVKLNAQESASTSARAVLPS